ncbi:MAG TPA: glycosyltransferase family protein [Anaerolineaceae bacterium]|nr:glycosyltransferase family protein [Anaerolineaceae bacterium]
MNSKKVVAIVQARMRSSRLPGKVLLDLGGKPALEWVLDRARRARSLDEVMVATTDDFCDRPVVDFCQANGYPVFRGSAFDVLDRYYQAALQVGADVVVRITGDCPLIDPGEIDHVVEEFFARGVDFAANRLPPPWKRTYPIGLDTEVCSFAALERAWREAEEKFEREHVMPYLYDQPGRFQTFVLQTKPDAGEMRWTLDTPADLELLRKIVDGLAPREDFSWREVLALVRQHPDWIEINTHVAHKSLEDVDSRYQG